MTKTKSLALDRSLDQALQYAAAGWHVFPVHTIRAGYCSCGDPRCSSPGKHPRTPNGLKDATTEERAIRAWWSRWPGANIGLATGPSGLVVVDVDPEHGGEESWQALCRQHPELQDTRTVRSGGGGTHKVYRAPPDARIRNSAGLLGPGIDVRGEGGYIIAPPSLHASGESYQLHPAYPHDPIQLPPALQALLTSPRNRRRADGSQGALADTIPEGKRNDTLMRQAGAMRRRGMTEAAIRAALLEENEARCNPPLPIAEVEEIARSAARYAPEPSGNGHTNGTNNGHSNGSGGASRLPELIAGNDGRSYVQIEGTSRYLDTERTAIYVKRAPSKNGDGLPAFDPIIKWCPIPTEVLVVDGAPPGRQRHYRITAGGHAEVVCQEELHTGAGWEHFPGLRGTAGRTNIDTLANAVLMQAAALEEHPAATATGWHHIAGGWYFLTNEASIGAQGSGKRTEILLHGALGHYALPDPPEGEKRRQAVEASLALLELGSRAVVAPAIGSAYLAPLRELLSGEPPDLTIFLHGPSGACKSELAALALAHFGPFSRTTLPAQFTDTANGLEGLLHGAKDALLVVDDYRAGGSPAETHAIESAMRRLARSVGNGSGKNRMGPDLGLRPERPPRCVVLGTGEHLPDDQSTHARLFAVPVTTGDIDREQLTRAQKRRDLLPAAMAGYVQWLAQHWEELKIELPDRFPAIRQQAQHDGQHAREPGQVAYLFLALETFTRFALGAGALDDRHRDTLLGEIWTALLQLVAEQAQALRNEAPAERFLALLGDAFASKRARLTDREGKPPGDALSWGWEAGAIEGEPRHAQDTLLGCVTEDWLLLYPEATYEHVAKAARAQGQPLPVEQATLWKRLDEAGLIAARQEDGHRRRTVTERIEGSTRRVIKLKRSALEPYALLTGDSGDSGYSGAGNGAGTREMLLPVPEEEAPPTGDSGYSGDRSTGAFAPRGGYIAHYGRESWGTAAGTPEHSPLEAHPARPAEDQPAGRRAAGQAFARFLTEECLRTPGVASSHEELLEACEAFCFHYGLVTPTGAELARGLAHAGVESTVEANGRVLWQDIEMTGGWR